MFILQLFKAPKKANIALENEPFFMVYLHTEMPEPSCIYACEGTAPIYSGTDVATEEELALIANIRKRRLGTSTKCVDHAQVKSGDCSCMTEWLAKNDDFRLAQLFRPFFKPPLELKELEVWGDDIGSVNTRLTEKDLSKCADAVAAFFQLFTVFPDNETLTAYQYKYHFEHGGCTELAFCPNTCICHTIDGITQMKCFYNLFVRPMDNKNKGGHDDGKTNDGEDKPAEEGGTGISSDDRKLAAIGQHGSQVHKKRTVKEDSRSSKRAKQSEESHAGQSGRQEANGEEGNDKRNKIAPVGKKAPKHPERAKNKRIRREANKLPCYAHTHFFSHGVKVRMGRLMVFLAWAQILAECDSIEYNKKCRKPQGEQTSVIKFPQKKQVKETMMNMSGISQSNPHVTAANGTQLQSLFADVRSGMLQFSSTSFRFCQERDATRSREAIFIFKDKIGPVMRYQHDVHAMSIDVRLLNCLCSHFTSRFGHNCSRKDMGIQMVQSCNVVNLCRYEVLDSYNGLQKLVGPDNHHASKFLLREVLRKCRDLHILGRSNIITNAAVYMRHKISISQRPFVEKSNESTNAKSVHTFRKTTAETLFCEKFYAVPHVDVPKDAQWDCRNKNIELVTIIVPLHKHGLFVRLVRTMPENGEWDRHTEFPISFIPFGQAMLMPTGVPYTTFRSSYSGNPHLVMTLFVSRGTHVPKPEVLWEYLPRHCSTTQNKFTVDMNSAIAHPISANAHTDSGQNEFYNDEAICSLAKLLFY